MLAAHGVEGICEGIVEVAPHIDEILVVGTEDGTVLTGLLCESLTLSVGTRHKHLFVGGSVGVGGIIHVARGCVNAIYVEHLIFSCCHATLQLAREGVEIEMVESIALRGQEDIVAHDACVLYRSLLDILIDLVGYNQFGKCREWIYHIYRKVVLMAIQCEHCHLRGILGRGNAGDISIGIHGHVELASLMRLDVIAPNRHLGIVLACLGIFIGIKPRIGGVFIHVGMTATEELHGILLHMRLVVFYPAYLLTVGSEHHRRVGGEFLLIHPVGHAVDNLIKLSVLGHLTLGIVIEQFDKVNVILPYEGNHCSVGREDGCLLRTSERECHHLVVAHVEDIVFGGERAAVYRFGGGLD